jgi:hypothetical protein
MYNEYWMYFLEVKWLMFIFVLSPTFGVEIKERAYKYLYSNFGQVYPAPV